MTTSPDRLIIEVEDRGEWISAHVEDFDGNVLGADTAPVVEGASFGTRRAVIRSAIEKALSHDHWS
jgi:hypothetical protein